MKYLTGYHSLQEARDYSKSLFLYRGGVTRFMLEVMPHPHAERNDVAVRVPGEFEHHIGDDKLPLLKRETEAEADGWLADAPLLANTQPDRLGDKLK